MPGAAVELHPLAYLARDHPETKVLILSMHKEKAYATRALGSGAAGYLLK